MKQTRITKINNKDKPFMIEIPKTGHKVWTNKGDNNKTDN